jgi:prepilin-type N-terminal cleavage/methylation domain-containing protein
MIAGRRRGFTLLEVLVALAVLGLLAVALSQGVHFGVLAWRDEARRSVTADDLATLDGTLRRLIEGIDPGDDLDPAPVTATRDRLECITRLVGVDGPVPARRMQAVLLVDRNHRLVLRWRQYPRATRIGDPLPLTETELLRGISRIELAFQREDGRWLGTWQSPDPPALVRIRLRFEPNDTQRWPDIVAAPRRDRL